MRPKHRNIYENKMETNIEEMNISVFLQTLWTPPPPLSSLTVRFYQFWNLEPLQCFKPGSGSTTSKYLFLKILL